MGDLWSISVQLNNLFNSPMNKSSLGIHQVKFFVQPYPGFSYGGVVGEATHGPRQLGKVSTRYNCRRLIVDADLRRNQALLHHQSRQGA